MHDILSRSWSGKEQVVFTGPISNLRVILVESALPPESAAKYYGDGGVGANSVLSSALASPKRNSAAVVGIAIQSGLLTTPDDGFPAWIVSTATLFDRLMKDVKTGMA